MREEPELRAPKRTCWTRRGLNPRPPHLAMRRSDRCTCLLHHRQGFAASGNRRDLQHLPVLSDVQARALSRLSYRPPKRDGPGGIRTRDPVVNSEETDLFTTDAAKLVVGEHSKTERRMEREALRPEPASRRPSRERLHGTQPIAVFSRDSGATFGAMYPSSSPPTSCFQGNSRNR